MQTAVVLFRIGNADGSAETETMRYRGVVFDMDGLMLDTERLGRMAWDLAERELAVVTPPDFYLKIIGCAQKDTFAIVRDALGPEFPAGPFMALANAHYHRLVHEAAPPVKDGLFPLLEFFRELELPLGVATSTNATITERNLRVTGLAQYFSVVVTGDRVSRGKPEPDIYLKATSELGLAPQDCLALEDSEHGVRAAHAARLDVYMVPDQIPPSPTIRMLATKIFDSLRDVLQFLR